MSLPSHKFGTPLASKLNFCSVQLDICDENLVIVDIWTHDQQNVSNDQSPLETHGPSLPPLPKTEVLQLSLAICNMQAYYIPCRWVSSAGCQTYFPSFLSQFLHVTVHRQTHRHMRRSTRHLYLPRSVSVSVICWLSSLRSIFSLSASTCCSRLVVHRCDTIASSCTHGHIYTYT